MSETVMLHNFPLLEMRAREASLPLSKSLAEAVAPYSHSLVKSSMLEVAMTEFYDKKYSVYKLQSVLLFQQTLPYAHR